MSSPNIHSPLARSFFDFTRQKKSSAGVNGSTGVPKQVPEHPPKQDPDEWYQLKPSVVEKRGLTRIKSDLKTNHTDYENLGEFIASKIGRAISTRAGSQITTPEVFLVENPHGISAASKFIDGFQSFSDLSISDTRSRKDTKIRYVKIDFNSKEKKLYNDGKIIRSHYGISDRPDLKLGVSRVVAVNLGFDNSDINLGGNMGIDAAGRVAGIDFGHAFGSLTRGLQIIGGGTRNKGNEVLDFINRDSLLDGKIGGSESKLWRDYNGMIPSKEFAQALKETSQYRAEVRNGFEEARLGMIEYKSSLKNDPAKLQMFIRSLNKLSSNIGAKTTKSADAFAVIDHTISNLKRYTEKRLNQMHQVGNLIELQAEIDNHLKLTPRKPISKEIFDKYTAILNSQYSGISNAKDRQITWAKTSAKNKPITGNLLSYIKQRRAEIVQIQKSEKTQQAIDSIVNSMHQRHNPRPTNHRTPRPQNRLHQR